MDRYFSSDSIGLYCFLGLEAQQDGVGSDPLRFRFVDSSLDGQETFFEQAGQSPWLSSQPDGGGNEDCVE